MNYRCDIVEDDYDTIREQKAASFKCACFH